MNNEPFTAMTAQEVFNAPAVKAVEIEILHLLSETDRKKRDTEILGIQHLLHVRKKILDNLFVMTDEHKQLLAEFNDALKEALCEMRWQAINMHDAALNADMYDVETEGRVFLNYKYPELHPVQTMRSKKIWAVLNGSYDNYMPMYTDGANNLHLNENSSAESENRLLYLSEQECNWNEGLDPEKTADMHLCYGVHNLICHNDFSFFDILWVRDFSIEITCESTHSTGSEECDDIDWSESDYYD